CVVPRRDLGFDLRVIRPTIRLLIAVGAKVSAGRVGRLDAIRRADKYVPAALAGRRLLRPPRENGARVQGSKVDLHAQPLQKVRGDVAKRLVDGIVLRRY